MAFSSPGKAGRGGGAPCVGAARIVGFASRFDWYFDGDVPSRMFDGVKLCEPSARVFDAVAGRVGATIAGRDAASDRRLAR